MATEATSVQIVRPFNIMCKPVCGACNLDCTYCYYTMKPRQLYPQVRRFLMTDELLRDYTRQYMELMPVHVDFGWQGGEPVLAGLDFFRRAVEYQKLFGRDGQEVANAFQTNGTLLDEEWCEFLAAHRFLVGLSIDGPAQWHDHYRRDKAGNASFHRAWAGLELLRKHRVEFNILVTLNSVNAPHAGDIYRYFTNRGVEYLQFIPILERDEADRPAPFSCTGEQFGRFLLEVFELWATRDVGRVSERLIDSVIHHLVFGTASTCCYSDRCANAHVLEFNGDLYVCDHFVYRQWRIGNIADRTLADLIADPMLQRFAELKTAVPDKCRACEYFEFCRAGCPKHHMPIGADAARVNWFCEGYKAFFKEALPELRRMAEYIKRNELPPLKGQTERGTRNPELGTRNSEPGRRNPEPGRRNPEEQPWIPGPQSAIRNPQSAMDGEGLSAAFAAGPPPGAPEPLKPRIQTRPPGRNDPCPCGSGKKYKRCCGAR